jgi:hypothetical protein
MNKLLYNNLPENITESGYGYIYILYSASYGSNNYKISRSNNLKKRISQHKCSHLDPPQYIYISKLCCNYTQAESYIHMELKKHRLTREFFNIRLEEAIEIINKIVHSLNFPVYINTSNGENGVIFNYDVIGNNKNVLLSS